ncbi:Pro-epidermal growth factor [Dirofilaria immitis]
MRTLKEQFQTLRYLPRTTYIVPSMCRPKQLGEFENVEEGSTVITVKEEEAADRNELAKALTGSGRLCLVTKQELL